MEMKKKILPITITLAACLSFDSNVCTEHEYSPVKFHIGLVIAIARCLWRCSFDTEYVVLTRFLKCVIPNGWRDGIHWYTGKLFRNHFNTKPFSCGSISYSQSRIRLSGFDDFNIYSDGTFNFVIFTVQTAKTTNKKD